MKKVYVIGIGPGDEKYRTQEAIQVLSQVDVICGYGLYVELVKDFHEGKKLLTTGMTGEVERCHLALKEADYGKSVAMVCSGDATVYGMAGLIYQLSLQYPEVEVEVVSGVTAALSGGSLLGAPLTGDFVVISLSDLLTPMEVIEKRLEAAAMGDFVTVIYNPSSKKRKDYLKKACDITGKHKSGDTICGIVENIGREGETTEIMTLNQLRNKSLTMFHTVFIGNKQTRLISQHMVTLRGYEKKYEME